MEEALEGAAYWLVLPDLLSLLTHRTLDHQPGDDTTHKGLGSPHESLILKMPYNL